MMRHPRVEVKPMSVLLELSIFPIGQGTSVSAHVAPVVAMIRASGHPYQLTAMGTLVETPELKQALDLIARANALLIDQGCDRVYATAKFDIRAGGLGRLEGKVRSVTTAIGDLPA
jgi:uncharacterized protein (TIGR00106 family)